MNVPAPAFAAPVHNWPPAVEVLNPEGTSDIVLLCEHASNHIPTEYDGLGLEPHHLQRHIAWDIGAANVTRALSRMIDAPAFLAGYSRLLVDLNRPIGAPTSIPAVSEATTIPGNLGLEADERDRRAAIMFEPFHERVAGFLDARAAAGRTTTLVTVHSFTPVFLGVARPWHVGVLYAAARSYGERLLGRLRAGDPDLVAAANEPYQIASDSDYAIPVHGDGRGLEAVLIEIRNDLIATPAGATAWAARLAAALVP